MQTLGRIILLCLTISVSVCVAQEVEVPRTFDHTIYVQIQSTPPGADIHAVSAAENRITRKLGLSPCTTAIGLKWGEKLARRNWKDLRVWCPGNACRSEYNSHKKTYDLYFACAAVKKGYSARHTEVKVATLTRPSFGWEAPDTWPDQVIVPIHLASKSIEIPHDPAKAPSMDSPQTKLPRIILADNAGGSLDLGTIEVHSNLDDALVFVDGKQVRKAPVAIMLPEGWHKVEVKRTDHETYSTEVHVNAGLTKRVQANLATTP